MCSAASGGSRHATQAPVVLGLAELLAQPEQSLPLGDGQAIGRGGPEPWGTGLDGQDEGCFAVMSAPYPQHLVPRGRDDAGAVGAPRRRGDGARIVSASGDK